MFKHALFMNLVVLVVSVVNAQIKKISEAPGVPGGAVAAAVAAANGEARKGSAAAISDEDLRANNQRAAKYISSYEQFAQNNSSSPVVSAARAEVQIISKCQVAVTASGYSIGHRPPVFCAGHPLAQHGGPVAQGATTLASLAGRSESFCEETPGPCSGFLAQTAQTILTAGHCTRGLSPKDFCSQFVFVFNRTGGKTEFSQDEVHECDSGVITDTTTQKINFNIHSAQGDQDHAAFHLKKAVPSSIAQPLQWRASPVGVSESLYAIGHPDGSPRMVSTLTQPHRLAGNSYNYLQMEGYVYRGNSGGPLLDAQGRLVGLMASVDDTRAGVPGVREPMVTTSSGKQCRTQAAPGTLKVEAIGNSTLISAATAAVRSGLGGLEIPTSDSRDTAR